MKFLLSLALAALASASPLDPFRLDTRQDSTSSAAAASCTKYPNNPRACYGQYDLDTDYFNVVPNTGVTRTYNFEITNTTRAPDGRNRIVLLVNGQLPGPTIWANWGDNIVVNVKNSLQNNGSSIHFHGIRQLLTTQQDGVPSLTQCPIAPGTTYTYKWRATQYGSSWYHSHFGLQAWEGVFGGIVINGPASANYDEDLGSLFLNEWNTEGVDSQYQLQLVNPGAIHFEGGLLNGTNTWTYPDGTTVGNRLTKTVTAGKKYRLRIINSSAHSHFKFSIDNHNLQVIATDFTPIRPFSSSFVTIDMGMRYDVIFTANQTAKNYWMRAIPQSFCTPNNTAANDIKGIIRYSTVSIANPTTTKNNYGDDVDCANMPLSSQVPWKALDVTLPGSNTDIPVGAGTYGGPPALALWKIGSTPFSVRWNDPTIKQYLENPSKSNWTSGQTLYDLPNKNQWVVWIIHTDIARSHPIHLHGHDFWVLAEGRGVYNPSAVTLNTKNPPRRDVITMPANPRPAAGNTDPTQAAGGFVVIAWYTDNPGSWLMHCHISFHATEGFALQVLERKSEIPPLIDRTVLNSTCSKWNAWAKTNPYGVQTTAYAGPYDSGV